MLVKSHQVLGGGGVRLHVVETGNPNGVPILFLHGFSQCHLSWSLQLNSDLATDYRLVAMDLRGHGLSDKPRDAYNDSKLWAGDVRAVITSLRLDRPVLCGWSYGPLVMLDYVRHYGDDALRGLHFVSGITKLGSDEATSVISPEFLNLVPGFFSSDVQESVRSLESLLRLCLNQAPSAADLYLMLGFNLAVPPYVREGLLSRTLDNDDLLPKVRKPVLITQGTGDRIIKPAAAEQHKTRLPGAQVHSVPNAGHAYFWEDHADFNQRLRAFIQSL